MCTILTVRYSNFIFFVMLSNVHFFYHYYTINTDIYVQYISVLHFFSKSFPNFFFKANHIFMGGVRF